MRSGLGLALNEDYKDALDFKERTKAFFLAENYMSDEANERLSPQSLMRAYTDGRNHVTEVYAAVLKSGDYVWIKTDVSLVTSFNSSDVIAFFSTIQIFQVR